jgi:CheY-like chemotaxis protein
LVDEIPSLCGSPRAPRRILWIDDKPTNNQSERRRLRRHGLTFESVVSTSEAEEAFESGAFAAVISDLGRKQSTDGSYMAGADLVAKFARIWPPIIIYTTTANAKREKERLLGAGASGVTGSPIELEQLVLKALGDPSVP